MPSALTDRPISVGKLTANWDKMSTCSKGSHLSQFEPHRAKTKQATWKTEHYLCVLCCAVSLRIDLTVSLDKIMYSRELKQGKRVDTSGQRSKKIHGPTSARVMGTEKEGKEIERGRDRGRTQKET